MCQNYSHGLLDSGEFWGELWEMWALELPKRQKNFIFEENSLFSDFIPLELENDILAPTHQENINSSNHGAPQAFSMESQLYRRCLNKVEKCKDQYIECENKQSNYFFVPKEWFNGVGVRKYFKQQLYDIDDDIVGVVPFSSQEREIFTKLQSAHKMNTTELFDFWKQVKDSDYHIRCGEDLHRKAFDVASVLKNIIYLRLFKPLLDFEYYELIKTNPKIYCPKCPKEVSLTCTCDFCAWIRYYEKDTFSIKKEINGHRVDCPTIEKLKLPFLQKTFKL